METVQTGEMVKGKAAISENVSKAAMGRRVVLWHGKFYHHHPPSTLAKMSTDAQLFDFVLANKDRKESTIFWDVEKAKEVNFGHFADVLEWGKRCYPLYVKFCDEVQAEALRDELRLWAEQAALVEEEAVKLGFQPSELANGDPEEEERKWVALENKRRVAEENLRAQKSISALKGPEVGVVRTLSDHLVTATTFVLPAALGDRNPFASAPVAEFVVRDGKVRIGDKELDAAKYRYFWPGTREAYSHAAANINLGELELELVIMTPRANPRILPTLASIGTQRCSNCTGKIRAAPVKAAKKKAKADNESQVCDFSAGHVATAFGRVCSRCHSSRKRCEVLPLGYLRELSMLVVMSTTFHPKRVGDGRKRPSAFAESNYENVSDADEDSPSHSMLSAARLYSEAFSMDFAQTMLEAARLNAQAAADALKAAELQMELCVPETWVEAAPVRAPTALSSFSTFSGWPFVFAFSCSGQFFNLLFTVPGKAQNVQNPGELEFELNGRSTFYCDVWESVKQG
ncbi:hypothetical protein BT69DRAFT_1320152 [Atractiella rhizophila]|nr:hypothetical protein BT69DRAFT_1320152 [Atractiella rhizophila]